MSNCPYCHGANIKRDGVTIKGFQRFYCHFCKKYWQGDYIRKKTTILAEQKKLITWTQSHPVLSQYLVAIASDHTFFLAYPNLKYHGLCIQLKPGLNSSDSKKYHITISAGYAFKVVGNYQEAIEQIENYVQECRPHLNSM